MDQDNQIPNFDIERLMREVNILFISDLHYDVEKEKSGKAVKADEINQKLVDALPGANRKDTPDILLIGGDLVNQGKESGYRYLFDLLDRLIAKFPNLRHTIYTTPGNHDIDRDRVVAAFPYLYTYKPDELPTKVSRNYIGNDIVNTIHAVSQLSFVGVGAKRKKLIEHLSSFEQEYFMTYLAQQQLMKKKYGLKIQRLKFPVPGIKTVYVAKDVLGLNLVSMNSSFFCNLSQTGNDRNNIFFVNEAVKRVRRSLKSNNCFGPVITFMHHPYFFMHESEFIGVVDKNQGEISNNFNKLAEVSDIILSGHVHGKLHEPSIIHQKSYSIINGTTFTGDKWQDKCYPYTFALVTVNKHLLNFRFRAFEYKDKGKGTKGVVIGKFMVDAGTSKKKFPFMGDNIPVSTSPVYEKFRLLKYIKAVYVEHFRRFRPGQGEWRNQLINDQLKYYEKDQSETDKWVIKEFKAKGKIKLDYYKIAQAKMDIYVLMVDNKDTWKMAMDSVTYPGKWGFIRPKPLRIYFAICMKNMQDLVDTNNSNATEKQIVETLTSQLKQAIWSYKFYAASTNLIFY